VTVETDISALRQDFQKHLEHDAVLQAQVAVNTKIGERIETHVKAQNGQVADVLAAQFRQEGATGMLKWVIGVVVIPLMALGVIVAGIVLGLVVTGG
jgi:hypothetical protein